jgi:hypothetical protein
VVAQRCNALLLKGKPLVWRLLNGLAAMPKRPAASGSGPGEISATQHGTVFGSCLKHHIELQSAELAHHCRIQNILSNAIQRGQVFPQISLITRDTEATQRSDQAILRGQAGA